MDALRLCQGYIAVNGCSLTVAEAQRERDGSGWFEVWLIPETLRITTFGDKVVGDGVHIEIERSTQVVVDTVRDALEEKLGPLLPVLEAIARERGIELTQFKLPVALTGPTYPWRIFSSSLLERATTWLILSITQVQRLP